MREIYTELETFGREITKRRKENTQRKIIFIFLYKSRRPTALSHKYTVRGNNTNVVRVIHCLNSSFCKSINLEHINMSLFYI